MKLVIDIPEDAYKLLNNEGVDWLGAEHILNAVANGIPLPKNHGRLIDADKLKKTQHDIYIEYIDYRHRCISVENIEEATTIIPAESEEVNEQNKIQS